MLTETLSTEGRVTSVLWDKNTNDFSAERITMPQQLARCSVSKTGLSLLMFFPIKPSLNGFQKRQASLRVSLETKGEMKGKMRDDCRSTTGSVPAAAGRERGAYFLCREGQAWSEASWPGAGPIL